MQILFIWYHMIYNTFIYNIREGCHMVVMTSLMLLKSSFFFSNYSKHHILCSRYKFDLLTIVLQSLNFQAMFSLCF